MNGNDDRRQRSHRALLRRLLTAAGVTGAGVANVGAGSCGACYDGTGQECRPVSAIDAWRIDHARPATGVCPDLEDLIEFASATRVHGRPTELLYSPDAGLPNVDAGEQSCCFVTAYTECKGGRPFLVAGQQRVASTTALKVGTQETPFAAIAAAWRHDALVEHASVASFARLALQLLHHGAPLDLIADTQAASLDEIRHAQVCKELSERLTGDTWTFGPLPVVDSLDNSSLLVLAQQNVVEGCIGEAVAACVVRARAEHAKDPSLRRSLTTIAEDETRHSVLAFKILAWTLTTAPSLASSILRTFTSELDQIERTLILDTEEPIMDPACGHLPAGHVNALRIDVCRSVLRPLLNELKANHPSAGEPAHALS